MNTAVFRCDREDPAEVIGRFLPRNYQAVQVAPGVSLVLVYGEDNAGWTMDGYVLPRLASGLYFEDRRWNVSYRLTGPIEQATVTRVDLEEPAVDAYLVDLKGEGETR